MVHRAVRVKCFMYQHTVETPRSQGADTANKRNQVGDDHRLAVGMRDGAVGIVREDSSL